MAVVTPSSGPSATRRPTAVTAVMSGAVPDAARGAALIALLVLTACAPATAGSARGGGASRWDHGADRVVISDFARITGVAVTQRFAFATSATGVATFDRLLQSWLPPVGEPERHLLRRIRGVAAHPLDDAAWIIEEGALVYFQPTLGWSLRTTIVGAIDAVLFDARDPQAGIFVRSFGRWTRVTPTGVALPIDAGELPPPAARATPVTLEELERRRPALRGTLRLLTRDQEMRSHEPSAVDEAPEGGEVWLGTWGYGVFRLEPEFMRGVHEPFGLLDRAAAALALAADGIWIAGDDSRRGAANVLDSRRSQPPPDALVFASPDLRDWEWRSTGTGTGLAGASTRALLIRGRRAWLGTDRGAFRIELAGASGARAMRASHGLPSDDILALAEQADGVWIGTTRGLAFVREPRDAATIGAPAIAPRIIVPGTPVRALAPRGGVLWIGSDDGLLLLPAGDSAQPVRIGAAASDARLRRPVHALAFSDSVMVVATDQDVMLIHAESGRVLTAPASANVRTTGTPAVVEIDARTLWLGGAAGVLQIDRATGASRLLRVPGEIPGPVLDIALTELFAWIGTSEGLVRLRRLQDGSVR